jgi:hypothetical protein
LCVTDDDVRDHHANVPVGARRRREPLFVVNVAHLLAEERRRANEEIDELFVVVVAHSHSMVPGGLDVMS